VVSISRIDVDHLIPISSIEDIETVFLRKRMFFQLLKLIIEEIFGQGTGN